MIMKNVRAIYRTLLIVTSTVILWIAFIIFYRLVPSSRAVIVRAWFLLMQKLIGIRILQRGVIGKHCLVSNHISYLDIVVIGGQSNITFVAKSEVAKWPVVGYLSKIAGTIFIERKRTETAKQRDELECLIESGRQICVFPEGTSSDGSEVIPFKSSLFQPLINLSKSQTIRVQPVSISYLRYSDGGPLNPDDASLFPWTGEDTLIRHLWQVLRFPGFGVDITFHDAIEVMNFSDRKELASSCWGASADGVRQQRNALATHHQATFNEQGTRWEMTPDQLSFTSLD